MSTGSNASAGEATGAAVAAATADEEASDADVVRGTAPSVPEVHPLETLHNSLTLNQLTTFLERMVDAKVDEPSSWTGAGSLGSLLLQPSLLSVELSE
jgi:hypothetical protein